MDERELVGLLYRSDWTRLTLRGSARGAAGSVQSLFGLDESRDIGREGPGPNLLDGDVALDLAPGRRFRLESADGRWAGGCDGLRVWQWLADIPADVRVGFSARPQPPLEQLLAPSWLLTGHTLTVREPTKACGRPGIQISAVPAAHGRRGSPAGPGELPPALRWHLDGRYERVVAVVDATLGFLLRCEFQFGDRVAVTAFTSLTVGAEADPLVFSAPPGSLSGSLPGDRPGPDGSLGGILGRSGLEAAKTVAGLAAGGLGAVIKYGPSRRADPFGVATAESTDPDLAMPADEPLPGWATDKAEPGATGAEAGGTPVSDDLLHLLYRGGVNMAPFTATLHEWTDWKALLAAVPPSARRAGFGGVGFLVDAVHNYPDLDGAIMHTVHEIRFGGRNRYRMDLVSSAPAARSGRPTLARITIACDGSRCWEVYLDRVEVGPAAPLHDAPAELADGSWLLRCRLAGGEEVVTDGRPGYRVIVTARPGSVPLLWHGWLGQVWLPAVAVVDAATGRLLRLTRYLGGQPARRLEFRSLADGGPDDFGFTPPAGLRVVDRSSGAFSDSSDDAEFSGSRPRVWPPDGTDFGDAARGAAGAVRQQVDEKVAAARGFLGSFLGGGPRDRG